VAGHIDGIGAFSSQQQNFPFLCFVLFFVPIFNQVLNSDNCNFQMHPIILHYAF